MPQLIFTAINLNERMWIYYNDCETENDRRLYSGRVLAIPRGGELQGITDDHLRKCAMDYHLAPTANWSVCGIDQGDLWHVVFLGVGKDRPIRLLYTAVIPADRIERVLLGDENNVGLLDSMNAQVIVCDSKPERAVVRRLAKAREQFLPHEYHGEEDSDKIREYDGEEYTYIQTGREETLQLTEALFDENNPTIEIPLEIDGEDICNSEFGKQLKVGASKRKVSTRTGEDIQFVGGSGVNNHLFHALNYANIAFRRFATGVGFGDGTIPVCGRLGGSRR